MVASRGARVLDPQANRPSQPALASVLAEVPRQLLGRCPRAQLVDVLVLQDRPAIDGVLKPFELRLQMLIRAREEWAIAGAAVSASSPATGSRTEPAHVRPSPPAPTPTLPGAALSSGGGSMTLQDLRDRQRQDKLEDIRRQVAEGRLLIRQMTAEERERYPPPSARPKTSRPQASRPPR